MLSIDLSGKRAFVAGVADDGGFGFAIAKALAEAGASVCVGTWPPALGIFKTLLERGKLDESLRCADGGKLAFERIYPLDAEFDTLEDDAGRAARDQALPRARRRQHRGRWRQRLRADFGEQPPRHRRALPGQRPRGEEAAARDQPQGLPRRGRRSARTRSSRWCSGSARSCGRAARSWRSPTWRRERVVPGYGGGMSSAKAALESDTRVLAYEAGRKWGHRVNVISAGPWASRAASAIGFIEHDDRVLQGELAAARGDHRRRGRRHRRVPRQPARPAASPAPPSTSTRATTRWAWRWTARHRCGTLTGSRAPAMGSGERSSPSPYALWSEATGRYIMSLCVLVAGLP